MRIELGSKASWFGLAVAVFIAALAVGDQQNLLSLSRIQDTIEWGIVTIGPWVGGGAIGAGGLAAYKAKANAPPVDSPDAFIGSRK